MIQAIRKLSVERGLDIREFSLLAFGGAGPIYAPFLARELGMKEVLVPFTPGVYAAQGLLMTDIRHTTQASWFTKLETISENKAKKFFSSLKNKLSDALQRDGIFKEDRYFKFYADLRCEGQFHDLTIELSDPTMKNNWSTEEIKINYYNEYERRYGHSDRSIELELISIRTDAYGRTPKPSLRVNSEKDVLLSIPSKKRSVCLDEVKGFEDVSIIERQTLNYGDCIEGPAVITQSDATTLVLHGQTASVISSGILRITEQSQSIK
jgi:N-methylhydantoinase A